MEGKGFYTGRYAYNLGGALAFYCNRALRIVPLYLFVVLIVGLFMVPGDVLSNKGAISKLLTFQYGADSFFWLDHLWSVCTEVSFYLIVPVFAWVFLRKARTLIDGIALFAVAVIGGVLFIASKEYFFAISDASRIAYPEFGPRSLQTGMMFFGAGMALNAIVPHVKMQVHQAVKYAMLIVLLGVLYAILSSYQFGNGIAYLTKFFSITIMPLLVTLIVSAYIIVEECSNRTKRQRLTAQSTLRNPARVIEWVGVLTYGIYLWHYPLLSFVIRIVPPTLPDAARVMVNFAAALFLGVVMAAITYAAIERPAERVKIFHVALPGWITWAIHGLQGALPARRSIAETPASPDCEHQAESAPRPIPG